MKKVMQSHWKRAQLYLKFGLVQSGWFSQPTFLIIGAQKSGTSSLRAYLAKHPNILPASKKEINFFDQDDAYAKGLTWYHSHFPIPNRKTPYETFEATPEYLYFPSAAGRIFQYNPSLRLIAVLRDPVERAYSAWNMFYNWMRVDREQLVRKLNTYGEETRSGLLGWLEGPCADSFEKTIEVEIEQIELGEVKREPSFVKRGFYYEQLTRYLAYFDSTQMYITDSYSLRTNTADVLNQVVHFLDLPELQWNESQLGFSHEGKYEQCLSERTRDCLRQLYKSQNEKLYVLLGKNFEWQ